LKTTEEDLYFEQDDSDSEAPQKEEKKENYVQIANNPGRMMFGVGKVTYFLLTVRF
jgi:hypothetical protein